jgi:hypothetical protein
LTSRAVPITVIPRILAICTAAVPTEPAAPCTSSVSPSLTPSVSSASSAVCTPDVSPPATSHGTAAGLGATSVSGTTTYSA